MPNNRRRLQGRVVSDKMDKTVVVEIERRKKHRIYEKVLISTKKVKAHDESNSVPVGAIVRIVESKPMSKHKRWAVEEVLVDPGNKVVTSVSDEQEVLETEQIGIEDDADDVADDAQADIDTTEADAPEASAEADEAEGDE